MCKLHNMIIDQTIRKKSGVKRLFFEVFSHYLRSFAGDGLLSLVCIWNPFYITQALLQLEVDPTQCGSGKLRHSPIAQLPPHWAPASIIQPSQIPVQKTALRAFGKFKQAVCKSLWAWIWQWVPLWRKQLLPAGIWPKCRLLQTRRRLWRGCIGCHCNTSSSLLGRVCKKVPGAK